MSSQRLVLPPNSRELFGCQTVTVGSGSYRNYERWVKKDKLLLPYKELRNGGNDMIWRGLRITLREINPQNSEKTLKEIKKAALAFTSSHKPNPDNLLALESELKQVIASNIPDYKEKLDAALEGRSQTIFSLIEPHLEGKTMLDVGAGNGLVSKLVKDRTGMDVKLIDVINYNVSGLPLELYNGEQIPFPNRSFDTVLVGMVYHHANNPIQLIKETERVTAKRMIVIESVEINKHHRGTQAIADWVYNRILNKGVNCPYHFQTPPGWNSTFGHFDLLIRNAIFSGIDMPLATEFHVYYALDIKKK
jgi:SAM-dependent methyltransferase